MSISVVIIAKNEADRIADCIDSVKAISDDILIIDSGSTDETIQIARSKSARVIEVDWMGYGPTKNVGQNEAKYDWILSLDADERITPALAKEIQYLQLEKTTVYAINRMNYYQGKAIHFSGWNPDWIVRLYPKKVAKWNHNLVHEKLIFPKETTIKRLKGRLTHYSYRSLDDHRRKIEQYARLKAKSWIEKTTPPGLLKRWMGPLLKGFSSFILKLGFLDGRQGWMIAKMNHHLVKRQLYYYDLLKKQQFEDSSHF